MIVSAPTSSRLFCSLIAAWEIRSPYICIRIYIYIDIYVKMYITQLWRVSGHVSDEISLNFTGQVSKHHPSDVSPCLRLSLGSPWPNVQVVICSNMEAGIKRTRLWRDLGHVSNEIQNLFKFSGQVLKHQPFGVSPCLRLSLGSAQSQLTMELQKERQSQHRHCPDYGLFAHGSLGNRLWRDLGHVSNSNEIQN